MLASVPGLNKFLSVKLTKIIIVYEFETFLLNLREQYINKLSGQGVYI